MTTLILVGSLLGVGGLCWAVYQLIARQRQLQAELTRLQQLAAEVSISAEAVLERADERIAVLHELLTAVELRAADEGRTSALPEPEPDMSAALTSLQGYQALRHRVWSLAAQGLSPMEIAREVEVPQGEVQLMLNLRKKKVTA